MYPFILGIPSLAVYLYPEWNGFRGPPEYSGIPKQGFVLFEVLPQPMSCSSPDHSEVSLTVGCSPLRYDEAARQWRGESASQ